MMIFMMTIIVKMSRMIMMITVAMMRMRAFYANIFPQFALYPAAPDVLHTLYRF